MTGKAEPLCLILAATAGALSLDACALVNPGAGPGRVGEPAAAACAGSPRWRAAAQANAASLYALPIDLFGRRETGWAVYAPAVEAEVADACPADSTGFARALARWQRRRTLDPTGIVSPQTLATMKARWQDRRPFVALRKAGLCPDPPARSALADVPPRDSAGGHPLQIRAAALRAYERMVAAARAAEPELAAAPERLTIFSAFRSPADDATRCAREGNCQGVTRAACSAHRTGLAVDLVLDHAPGSAVDSAADADRRVMISGLAYRWLVANAARFGFVNYVFEPWHWEWTGQRP